MHGRVRFSDVTEKQIVVLNREMFTSGMHVIVVKYENGDIFRAKLMVI